MKSFPIVVVAKQMGIGLALTLLVAVATVLFNFLGTIGCSTLVGMMLGSTRQWKWQILLLSLVFPGVMMVFLQASKTDLTFQRIILLSLLCFGAFWVTYVLTFAMVYFEKQNECLPADQAPLGSELTIGVPWSVHRPVCT